MVGHTQPCDRAQGWVGPTTEHLPGSIQSKACEQRTKESKQKAS
jgi:hypothetical protein